MLHGRVIRRRRIDATLEQFDEAAAESFPGVAKVVRLGAFLGVVAEREEVAVAAADKAATLVKWVTPGPFPIHPEQLLQSVGVKSRTHEAGIPPEGGLKTYRGTFTKPFLAHASLGPCCAVAVWSNESVQVWTHTQGVFPLLRCLARALEVPENAIQVIHVPGAGCYGHNGADDVALDAALLARAVPGTPVRVLWSRSDELSQSPLGTAMAISIRARVTPDGQLASWSTDIRTGTHACRPGWGPGINLLAADELANRSPARNGDPPGCGERNSVPLYDIPYVVVDKNVVDLPLRLSSLRTLGGYGNVFALESMMDEIACDLERDPAEFRLAHLRDGRARAVIERVVAMSPWGDAGRTNIACGLGFARYKATAAYCAVVAEVALEADVRVTRAWAVVDAGLTINPDGVRNQIEGGIIQSMSWTLRERVIFDEDGVASLDWQRYPITTFEHIPEIEVDVIQRVEQPSLGVGEVSQGPTAAAIGNAIRQILGVRIYDLPISRERLLNALS